MAARVRVAKRGPKSFQADIGESNEVIIDPEVLVKVASAGRVPIKITKALAKEIEQIQKGKDPERPKRVLSEAQLAALERGRLASAARAARDREIKAKQANERDAQLAAQYKTKEVADLAEGRRIKAVTAPTPKPVKPVPVPVADATAKGAARASDATAKGAARASDATESEEEFEEEEVPEPVPVSRGRSREREPRVASRAPSRAPSRRRYETSDDNEYTELDTEAPSDIDIKAKTRTMVPKAVKQKVQQIKAINQAMTAVQSDPTGIRGLIASRWGR